MMSSNGYILGLIPSVASIRRIIALSPLACSVMRQYLDNQMHVKSRFGKRFEKDSLVFSQVNGQPLKGNGFVKFGVDSPGVMV